MELDDIKQVADGAKSMGADSKNKKEEKEKEAENATTAEKSNEQATQEAIKETAEFAKGAGEIAARGAAGDEVGAGVEAVKLVGKNKIARTIIIIAIIQPILTIIILISIILGTVGLIFNFIGSIGEFFAGLGNWFSQIFDDGSSRSEIIIGDEEFEGIKNTLAQNGINQNAAGLSDLVLKTAILANYRTMQPFGIVIKIGVTQSERDKLEEYGYSFKFSDIPQDQQKPDEDLKEGEEKSLYYLESEGSIYLRRPQTINDDDYLKYVDMATMEAFQRKEGGDADWKRTNGTGIYESYSIDQNGNLVIPHLPNEDIYIGEKVPLEDVDTLEEKVKYYDSMSLESENEYHEVSTVNYIPLVSKYTIPLEFITTLTTYTQNEQFGLAIANLINSETKIDLILLDTEVTTEERIDTKLTETVDLDYKLPYLTAKTYTEGELFWQKYVQGGITTIFDQNLTGLLGDNTYKYSKEQEMFMATKKITTSESISAQVGTVNGLLISKETPWESIEFIEGERELDDSIEKNPSDKISEEDITLIDTKIDNLYETEDGGMVQSDIRYLYDTNAEIKDFVDNKLSIGIDELEKELNNVVNTNEKIENDVNELMENKMRGDYQAYIDQGTADDMSDRFNLDDRFNLEKTIVDYKESDVNWKMPKEIDDLQGADFGTHTVYPVNITATEKDITKQTTYYTKKNQYIVNDSFEGTTKEEDNTDRFIELLMDLDTKEPKEYRNYTGYKETPLTDLTSSPDMLFETFAFNPNIANMENLMRWIMQKITGNDYGVEDFDTVIFDLNKFNKVGVQSSMELFREYLFTVEHGVLYNEYLSNPDMKYFEVGRTGYNENHLYVGFGLDLETSGYHDELLAIYNRENGTRKKSLEVGDKLKVEDVMKIIDEMIQQRFDTVNSITSGLKLEEYQKHVLVSRLYNGCPLEEDYGYGADGGTFVEVYNRYWKESDNYFGEKDKVNYEHSLYKYHLNMWDSGNAGDKVLVGRRREEWVLFQTGYYEALGKYYTESGATDFVSRVAEIADYMYDNKYKYYTPSDGSYSSTFEDSKSNQYGVCASSIGWAAADLGLTIQSKFGGSSPHWASLVTASPDFELIKTIPDDQFESYSSEFLPGDVIYFTGPGDEGAESPKHVETYAGDNMTYNTGYATDNLAVLEKQPQPYNQHGKSDLVHIYRVKK